MQPAYSYAWRRFGDWMRRSAGYLWLAALAAYLFFSAGQSIYRSYQAQQETMGWQEKLAKAQLEKQRLEALLVYYQTDSYKERELRRALLLKRPEEKVYALPEASDERTFMQAIELELATVQQDDGLGGEEVPSWRLWLDYLLK